MSLAQLPFNLDEGNLSYFNMELGQRLLLLALKPETLPRLACLRMTCLVESTKTIFVPVLCTLTTQQES